MELTKTSKLLLKGMRFNEKNLIEMGFINSYIGDVFYEGVSEGNIFLLFKVPENKVYEFSEFILQNERKIVEMGEYDYEDGLTMLVMEYPFQDIYKLFIEGKYSKFPLWYKELFKKQASLIEKLYANIVASPAYMIIHKDPELRKYQEDKMGVELEDWQEVSSIINITEETFDHDEFIKSACI